MSEYKKLLPTINAVTKPFWAGNKRRELMLPRCDKGHIFFYPRAFCPQCWSPNIS
ncbi:zinc ribbon domain-containing protein, partial [Chloroflexota bacterium]